MSDERKVRRKYWHIKVNPKITKQEFKMIRAKLPYPNLYHLDFVNDVEETVIKEITSEEFNNMC